MPCKPQHLGETLRGLWWCLLAMELVLARSNPLALFEAFPPRLMFVLVQSGLSRLALRLFVLVDSP